MTYKSPSNNILLFAAFKPFNNDKHGGLLVAYDPEFDEIGIIKDWNFSSTGHSNQVDFFWFYKPDKQMINKLYCHYRDFKITSGQIINTDKDCDWIYKIQVLIVEWYCGGKPRWEYGIPIKKYKLINPEKWISLEEAIIEKNF